MVSYNLFCASFLVTPCLVVAVQLCMEWTPIKKKVIRIRKFDLNLGCSYFFIYLASYCSYSVLIFLLLRLDWATVFVKSCWNYTSPCRIFISWSFLLITVHFCFPNLDKKFFVLISTLNALILFVFSSKSHCSFKIVLIKK